MARYRRRTKAAPPQRLILDSGALIALSRQDARARGELAAAYEQQAEITIPSVVIAETVRDAATDAPVNRVLDAIDRVAQADESTCRLAGRLLGASRSASTIDAVVVATAVQLGGGMILTGDPDDLSALAVDQADVLIQPL